MERRLHYRPHSVIVRALLVFLCVFLLWILVLGGQNRYWISWLVIAALAVTARFVPLPDVVTSKATAANTSLRWTFTTVPLAGIFWTAVVLRFAWAMYYGPVPPSDFEIFFQQSIKWSNGFWSALGDSKSPVAVMYYGTLFKLFSNSLIFIYAANAFLGGLHTYLVYKIALRTFGSEGAARFGALAVAVFPSFVMFSALPSSEAPFVTILLVMILAASKVLATDQGPSLPRIVGYGLLLGFLTAGLHLSRNIGIMIGVWTIAAVVILASLTPKQKLVLSISSVLCALVFLFPQIKYNYGRYGTLSIQSTRWSSFNLLFGTSRESKGSWSDKDLETVKRKYPLTDSTFADASKYARKIALSRLTDDPFGFLGFALTTKFKAMWCDDNYGVKWSLRKSKFIDQDRGGFRIRPARGVWLKVSKRFYYGFVFVVLCSLGLLALGRIFDRGVFVVVAGVVFVFFLAHVFIEVQPRYHHAAVHMLCILAGAGLGRSLRSSDPRTDES